MSDLETRRHQFDAIRCKQIHCTRISNDKICMDIRVRKTINQMVGTRTVSSSESAALPFPFAKCCFFFVFPVTVDEVEEPRTEECVVHKGTMFTTYLSEHEHVSQ
jgi:hypothetical protein